MIENKSSCLLDTHVATWSSTLTNLVVSFLTADFSAARCVFEMKVTLVLFSVGEFRRNPVN